MTTKEKKTRIHTITKTILQASHDAMIEKIDKVINSSAVDIDSWETNKNPLVLPMCIANALLQIESDQLNLSGSSFEKQVKKEVRNIRRFI